MEFKNQAPAGKYVLSDFLNGQSVIFGGKLRACNETIVTGLQKL